MSKLNKETVMHVALLAKLSLKPYEVKKFSKQLTDIFNFVDQIGKMKTKGVIETSQVTGVKNIFREDKINRDNMLTQKQALGNAKRKYKGYFLVKAVFDK